jgi:RNA polymerase-binding transcription factor DksA
MSLEARKEQLINRLAELNARLHHIEKELDGPVTRDVDDQAIEREEDEVLEGMGNAGLLEIRMIEAALARMEAGSYGVCVSCGDEITPQRLDVLPYTPVCRLCSQKAENK